jgi:SAM-dependent methyltransferase
LQVAGMSCCGHCDAIETEFGDRTAARELRRYRRRGPVRTTRLLLDALRRDADGAGSLLDVGGGIGAVHHELLAIGTVEHATHVDASAAYLRAAREEASRRGRKERVRFVHGDFVELAPELPAADIVTLDRVICCYPDMERMVGLSARRARRVWGAVFPRDAWWVRLGLRLPNLWFRVRRSPFRVFLHPPDRIDEIVRGEGLVPRYRRRTLAWEVAVYTR